MDTLINNLHPRTWILGGVVGTIVLAIFMEGLAPIVLGGPLKAAALICGIFGWTSDMMLQAEIIHYLIGLIAFPIGYVVFRTLFPTMPSLLMGAVYGVGLWLVAMAIIAPMAGVAAFLGGGQMMIGSLVAHTVYGIVLSLLILRTSAGAMQPA